MLDRLRATLTGLMGMLFIQVSSGVPLGPSNHPEMVARWHTHTVTFVLIVCLAFSSYAQNILPHQSNTPPTCGNCHVIADTFYECYHKTMSSTEPCDDAFCIENILITATCDFYPDGDPNRHLCSARQTSRMNLLPFRIFVYQRDALLLSRTN